MVPCMLKDKHLEIAKDDRHLCWRGGVQQTLLKAFLVYAGTQPVSLCSVCPGGRADHLASRWRANLVVIFIEVWTANAEFKASA